MINNMAGFLTNVRILFFITVIYCFLISKTKQKTKKSNVKKDKRGEARAAVDVVLRTLNVDSRLRV